MGLEGYHTLETGGGASLSGTDTSSDGTRRASLSSRTTRGGGEEVRAVAGLLTVGKLLGVGGRAIALGAGGDAFVGVVGLAVARAGDFVAGGDAAAVRDVAWRELEVVMDIGRGVVLTLLGTLGLGAQGDGGIVGSGGLGGCGGETDQGRESDEVELHGGDRLGVMDYY